MQDNPFLAHLNGEERKLLHKVAVESLLHSRFSPDPALDSLIARGYLKTSKANLAGHQLVRLTAVGRGAAELLIYEAFPFPE
jgi:hypothetical protein